MNAATRARACRPARVVASAWVTSGGRRGLRGEQLGDAGRRARVRRVGRRDYVGAGGAGADQGGVHQDRLGAAIFVEAAVVVRVGIGCLGLAAFDALCCLLGAVLGRVAGHVDRLAVLGTVRVLHDRQVDGPGELQRHGTRDQAYNQGAVGKLSGAKQAFHDPRIVAHAAKQGKSTLTPSRGATIGLRL